MINITIAEWLNESLKWLAFQFIIITKRLGSLWCCVLCCCWYDGLCFVVGWMFPVSTTDLNFLHDLCACLTCVCTNRTKYLFVVHFYVQSYTGHYKKNRGDIEKEAKRLLFFSHSYYWWQQWCSLLKDWSQEWGFQVKVKANRRSV